MDGAFLNTYGICNRNQVSVVNTEQALTIVKTVQSDELTVILTIY